MFSPEAIPVTEVRLVVEVYGAMSPNSSLGGEMFVFRNFTVNILRNHTCYVVSCVICHGSCV